MADTQRYLDNIKTKIATSASVASVVVIAEHVSVNCGYFRARLTLVNGDFLEVSEFFAVQAGSCSTVEYRYQWMDHLQQRLIRRWDNAEHFPGLAAFPHHVHIGSEEHVASAQPMGIVELIESIENDLSVGS